MTDEPDWDELDQQDWREDGPFDYDEVDLEGDTVPRIDMGALIITPIAGSELRLQVREGSQDVITVLCLHEESGLELSLYAAPRSGHFWPEVREMVIEEVGRQQGKYALRPGPLGTELHRLMPVRTPDGEDAVQPSRMFCAEGQGWLLRGVMLGKAAMVEGNVEPATRFYDMFRDTIVRRGEAPMAPGEVIALTMPQSFA